MHAGPALVGNFDGGRFFDYTAYGDTINTAARLAAANKEAFAKLEAGDTAAMPAFAALVGLHADDTLAGFHLRRLLNGARGIRTQLEWENPEE